MRINFRNGAWGELEVSSDELLNLHMAETCLHYGQEAFEGLKAFRGQDGKVRIFRLEENAARLQSTCQGILTVSYTHLDVYTRQNLGLAIIVLAFGIFQI